MIMALAHSIVIPKRPLLYGICPCLVHIHSIFLIDHSASSVVLWFGWKRWLILLLGSIRLKGPRQVAKVNELMHREDLIDAWITQSRRAQLSPDICHPENAIAVLNIFEKHPSRVAQAFPKRKALLKAPQVNLRNSNRLWNSTKSANKSGLGREDLSNEALARLIAIWFLLQDWAFKAIFPLIFLCYKKKPPFKIGLVPMNWSEGVPCFLWLRNAQWGSYLALALSNFEQNRSQLFERRKDSIRVGASVLRIFRNDRGM